MFFLFGLKPGSSKLLWKVLVSRTKKAFFFVVHDGGAGDCLFLARRGNETFGLRVPFSGLIHPDASYGHLSVGALCLFCILPLEHLPSSDSVCRQGVEENRVFNKKKLN